MDDLTKGIRSWPRVLVANMILLLCISILSNYLDYSRGKTVELKVRTRYNDAVHYNKVSTVHGVFESGSNGTLSVKPQSFLDAYILTYATSESFNVFDYLYFLTITCLLWWMTYDIRKEDIFSKKVITGLRWIGWSIAFYGILKMLIFFPVNAFIGNYTGEVFGAQEPIRYPYSFLMGALLFQLIPMFIQKARQIQKEKELTI
ncbi:MAG: DUF2975 domain-containing protein [Sphingobacteriaceae bacterium]|nr:DUF2975 domain-containing protein [Sphingobacteriaceae bacterium]